MRTRFICPNCGEKSAVAIIYGFPSKKLLRQEKRKEVVLGGCIVMADDPDRKCLECGHRWSHQPDTKRQESSLNELVDASAICATISR
jgi:hypothetical protein